MADEQSATPAPSTGGAPSSDEKVMAALSYLGILFLIPLLTKKDSKFAMFHAKQGLVLFILEIIFGLAQMFLAFIPFVGWLIIPIIWVIIGIFSLIGLIQAFSGNYWKMPILSGWAESFKF